MNPFKKRKNWIVFQIDLQWIEIMKKMFFIFLTTLIISVILKAKENYNILFIISDDLTYTALSCYGNEVCKTPHIDKLAKEGVRFTQAYCQGTYCGPSRASFMSGYYPHATGVLGYKNPRPQIGERSTWSQHFRNHGYHAARISKIFHMGVPGGIESGGDGADDSLSWDEKYNSKGPEWRAPGDGETLQKNPDGQRPVVGGNTFVVVEADGGDLVHSDGKTAKKAVELLEKYKSMEKPFWLGVGFVRPHVPFVAPRKYYKPFKPYSQMVLPKKFPGNWDDIPQAGINYCTSENMQMDIHKQKKAVGGYYASVAYLDAQVGKVMNALEKSGKRDETIVIFTSDHGFHLGEHDFWAKVSLRDESAKVPLIISMPGKNGVDIVKILKDKYPALKILMLSMHPEDQYAVRCLKAGASGYLTKNTAPEKLVDAIQVIAAGSKYITPELAESLASHLTEDSEKPLHATLSDREFQTIRMIAAGKKLSEIADELSLSPKTVSVYRARILEEMRMKTNGELTRYALENGLI